MASAFLGIDVGSVSCNVVLVDSEDTTRVLDAQYIRTSGQPLKTVMEGLRSLQGKGWRDQDILAVGVTGSGRNLIGTVVGADVVRNEITAHAVAAISQVPDVRTILEIGGQDSKLIIVRDGVVTDFAMNTVCAAGTGSFLDQQAFRLQIPIEEFGALALKTPEPVRIAGRCTVFAESDMIHKQQLGYEKGAIVKGLCEALVRNYLSNIAKSKRLDGPVLFQGGVAHNEGIRAAIEAELGQKLIIPRHFDVMGAVGSALLAGEEVEARGTPTAFKGLNVHANDLKVQLRECADCANNCEMTEAFIDGKAVAVWGDKCGKWQVAA